MVQVNRYYECLMLCAAERLKKLRQLGGWQINISVRVILKKHLNASKPSEHPPSGEKLSKYLGGNIGCRPLLLLIFLMPLRHRWRVYFCTGCTRQLVGNRIQYCCTLDTKLNILCYYTSGTKTRIDHKLFFRLSRSPDEQFPTQGLRIEPTTVQRCAQER